MCSRRSCVQTYNNVQQYIICVYIYMCPGVVLNCTHGAVVPMIFRLVRATGRPASPRVIALRETVRCAAGLFYIKYTHHYSCTLIYYNNNNTLVIVCVCVCECVYVSEQPCGPAVSIHIYNIMFMTENTKTRVLPVVLVAPRFQQMCNSVA